MLDPIPALRKIHRRMKDCRKCPAMCDRAVHGPAIETPIMLLGQAPGVHEGARGKPFAHTAGKTLFRWMATATGMNEEEVRDQVYFSAVARCFPGKAKSGSGDRVPDKIEILNCRENWVDEIMALRPRLLLLVGKLAINEAFKQGGKDEPESLADVVGKKVTLKFGDHYVVAIALPHPSGVSRWPQTEPGKTLLARAITLIAREVQKLDL